MILPGIFASQMSGHLSNYVSLQTVTVGSGGASSVVFSSIPSGYTHLQLRYLARNSAAQTVNDLNIFLNSDTTTTGYNQHRMYGNGSGVTSQFNTATGIGFLSGNSTTSTVFCVGVVDFLDYTNTNKYKTIRSISGFEDNASGYGAIYSVLRQDTTPISTITLKDNGGTNLAQYSSFALYGVK